MRSAGLALSGLCAIAPLPVANAQEPSANGPFVLPCRFPHGRILNLSLEQHFTAPEGRPVTISIVRKVRFGRDVAGDYLDAWSPLALTNDSGIRAQRLAALYDSADQEPMRLRLDSYGAVVGIAAEEVHWASFLARQRRLTIMVEAKDGRTGQRTELAYAALVAASPARRRAMLGGFLEPIVRHCGQVVTGQAGDEGQPLVRVEQKVTGDGAVSERISYRIDRESGLATLIERVATPVAAPAQALVEYWRLGEDLSSPE